MSAFFGEKQLKDKVLERLNHHKNMDEIIQGKYWEEGKGCHLGCITHVNEGSHEKASQLFNLPLDICSLLESVFEGLPPDKASKWVAESVEAIPVGADMSLVKHHLAYWLLGPDSPSAKGNENELVKDSVSDIRLLHLKALRGETINNEQLSAALSAAESAVESAAESAVESAAWGAAWSAVLSAAESEAESAVWSAAESEAESAESAAWEEIATKCIDIFKACPVAEETDKMEASKSCVYLDKMKTEEFV